jgi:anti-anti-sigma factor
MGEERGPLTIPKESFDDHADHPTASNGPADGGEWDTHEDLLGLTVQHPAAGVCVVTVDGELDTLSVPLLEACVAEQVAAAPAHLILDLQPVRFLASTGLTSLLRAHELAETTGTQLHLAGLVTRVVARALHVTELLECFDTYPTLTDALAVLTD